MGNLSKQVEGGVKEFGGLIEKNIGKLIGSKRMQTRGSALQRKGKKVLASASGPAKAKTTTRTKTTARRAAASVKKVATKARKLGGTMKRKATRASRTTH